MSMKLSIDKGKPRKSLMELTAETTVRDPAAHARLQFMELDKTAKRSMAKKKKCNEQLAADKKALSELEAQIATLRAKYDPLCEHLQEAKEQKAKLVQTLEQCVSEERRIMGNTKGVIQVRRQEESKMTKKMGTLELEMLRGYSLAPESTFHQTRGSNDGSPSASPAKSRNATTGHASSSPLTKRAVANKAATLPPIK